MKPPVILSSNRQTLVFETLPIWHVGTTAAASPYSCGQQLDRLGHPSTGDGGLDARSLSTLTNEADLLVELGEGLLAALALADGPALGAQGGVELFDGGQLEVHHAVWASLDGEGGDGKGIVVVTATVCQIEVALVMRAGDPGCRGLSGCGGGSR